MQFFLLGLAALVLALFSMGGFTRANPAALARQLRLAGGALALGASALFLVRGVPGIAALLGMLGSWLLGWSGNPPTWGRSQTPRPGKSSTVTTDHLSRWSWTTTAARWEAACLKGMFAGPPPGHPEAGRGRAALARLPLHRSAVGAVARNLSRSRPPHAGGKTSARRGGKCATTTAACSRSRPTKSWD